jgi:hypothetical protein
MGNDLWSSKYFFAVAALGARKVVTLRVSRLRKNSIVTQYATISWRAVSVSE